MSIELHIFVDNQKIPTRDRWQEEIDRLGFPAIIQDPFTLQKDRGFRPASYCGKSSGFEFYLDPSKDILVSYPHIASRVGSREACATFRWGGDIVEMSTALSAAVSLAVLTDGIYYYPDDDILYEAEEAFRATRMDLGLK